MNNSQANASANGWDFQENAALWLFLHEITDISSVKVEGEEDIVLNYQDSQVGYFQAKCAYNSKTANDYRTKFTDGLRTLNEHVNGNIKRLGYISNSPKPINSDNPRRDDLLRIEHCKQYNELSDASKSYIDEIINSNNFNNINKDILSISVLPFEGDADEQVKYQYIKEKSDDFIEKCGISRSRTKASVLEKWQLVFHQNASRTTREETKDKLVWIIIVQECDISDDDYDELKISDNIKTSLQDKYSHELELINNFSFSNRVYQEYNANSHKFVGREEEKKLAFIDSNWQEYKDDFNISNATDKELESLIKVALKKILDKNETIEMVRKNSGVI